MKNATKTRIRAFKPKCYWAFKNGSWFLSDYTGEVYLCNRGRLWMDTPTGYISVSKSDFSRIPHENLT